VLYGLLFWGSARSAGDGDEVVYQGTSELSDPSRGRECGFDGEGGAVGGNGDSECIEAEGGKFASQEGGSFSFGGWKELDFVGVLGCRVC
jgi:hypothetical protein